MYICTYIHIYGLPRGLSGKETTCQSRQKTQVPSLGREDPLEKEMATRSSILAWRIPGTEDPGRLQSMRSQRVRHDWTNKHLPHLWNSLLEFTYRAVSGTRMNSSFWSQQQYCQLPLSALWNHNLPSLWPQPIAWQKTTNTRQLWGSHEGLTLPFDP